MIIWTWLSVRPSFQNASEFQRKVQENEAKTRLILLNYRSTKTWKIQAETTDDQAGHRIGFSWNGWKFPTSLDWILGPPVLHPGKAPIFCPKIPCLPESDRVLHASIFIDDQLIRNLPPRRLMTLMKNHQKCKVIVLKLNNNERRRL